MVCINTNNQRTHIQFTHFVEIPTSNCIMATAREEGSRKLKVYLIHKESSDVYYRKGLSDAWFNERRQSVRELLSEALNNTSIPHYTTNNIN